MARIVVEQHFSEPMSEDVYQRFAQRLDPCLETHGAVWLRSYVSEDRRHVVCEFEAADAESVRQSYRSSEVPYERVWAATTFAVEDYPEMYAKVQALRSGRT